VISYLLNVISYKLSEDSASYPLSSGLLSVISTGGADLLNMKSYLSNMISYELSGGSASSLLGAESAREVLVGALGGWASGGSSRGSDLLNVKSYLSNVISHELSGGSASGPLGDESAREALAGALGGWASGGSSRGSDLINMISHELGDDSASGPLGAESARDALAGALGGWASGGSSRGSDLLNMKSYLSNVISHELGDGSASGPLGAESARETLAGALGGWASGASSWCADLLNMKSYLSNVISHEMGEGSAPSPLGAESARGALAGALAGALSGGASGASSWRAD